jgi:hypothetical protein
MPSAILVDSDTNAQFDGHSHPHSNGNSNPDRYRGGYADGHSHSNGQHPSHPITHTDSNSGCFRRGNQEAAPSLREWFPRDAREIRKDRGRFWSGSTVPGQEDVCRDVPVGRRDFGYSRGSLFWPRQQPVYNYHLYYQSFSGRRAVEKYDDLRLNLNRLLQGFEHTFGDRYDAWARKDPLKTAILLSSKSPTDLAGSPEIQVHAAFSAPQW